jgi:ABC-type Zn uptake system ZnuABC Zn-binding protein ZnuA
MKKGLLLFLLLLSATLLWGCQPENDGYDIYVTIYPVEYLVDSLLVGTDISCGIVPGVSSHSESIDWSPKEIIAMTSSRYLFYVGANLDMYIDEQSAGVFQDQEVTLVKIETEDPDFLIPGVVHEHEDSEESESTLGYDPHFWVSPRKMIELVDLIYLKLIDGTTGYPEHAATILNNKTVLLNDLVTLDAQYDEVINETSNAVMTSTNLYGYLHYSYGLVTLPISPGYHEEAEQYTTAQKEEIVAEALLHDIRFILYEKSASSPLSDAVFDALINYSSDWDPIKLEYDILHSFPENDRQDEFGNPRDYCTVMLENLEALKTATGYTE